MKTRKNLKIILVQIKKIISKAEKMETEYADTLSALDSEYIENIE